MEEFEKTNLKKKMKKKKKKPNIKLDPNDIFPFKSRHSFL